MFFIGGVASTTSQTLDAQDLMIRRDGTEIKARIAKMFPAKRSTAE